MRITLNLPDSLVRQLKLRAELDGGTLSNLAADLLQSGLAAAPQGLKEPVIGTDEETGLPVIQCGHPARPGEELTPDRIAEVLMEEEVEKARAFAHGNSTP